MYKNQTTHILAISIAMSCFCGWSAAAGDALPRVRGALDSVRSQVTGNEDRTEDWESILALKPLAIELDKGEDADVSAIRNSISGLTDAEKSIDKARLEALRDALAAWVKDAPVKDAPAEGDIPVRAPDPDVIGGAGLDLGSPDGDEDAGDSNEANDDEDVEAARKKLSDDNEDGEGLPEEGATAVAEAVEALNDSFDRTGGSGAWTKILPLRAIADAADEPADADAQEVRKMLQRVESELAQLDRSNFTRLRRALVELQNELEYPLEENCALMARRAVSQFGGVDGVRVFNARNELQQSIQRLNNFLATGSQVKRDGWNEFLSLEDLTSALNRSGTPLVRTLVGSFNKFNSGESGLELRPFSDVRDDLEIYLELLQYNETAPGRLAEGRQELQSATDALARFLTTSTDEKEKAWREFLEWETLTKQLAETVPDTKALETVAEQFDADENGLDLEVYRNVAGRIAKLQELIRLHNGATAEDLFRARIEKLAQTLESHELDPTNDTAAELVKELKWMEATGFVPDVASCIRGGYSKQNFFASVSGDFVTKQMNDTVTDAQSVNRCFEGSHVRGCARTNAQVTAKLQPSLNGIIIDVLLNGQTITNASAQQRKVYVRTQSNTNIVASKRLFANLDGLWDEPAVARACTCQQTCGVCIDRRCNAGKRLITRIAKRKAGDSKGRAQNLASCEAQQTIAQRMDDQAREMIQKANQQMRDFRASMSSTLQGRDELRPENLSLRSTAEKIFADGKITAGRYLGAPSDPPQVGTDSDLSLQVHQSAVNNALANVLGGIKLDDERMVQMMEENGLPVPEELKVKPATQDSDDDSQGSEDADADDDEDNDEDEEEDAESWSLTFDTLQPATVTFAEGKIRIAIRGRRFTQGAQEINEPIEISATYKLRANKVNMLEARMIGDVDILFVRSPGRLNTRQLAYKTFIRRKTKPLFKRTFSIDDLPAGELSDQLRTLRVDHVEATRGWIAIAMSLEGLANSLQLTMNQ